MVDGVSESVRHVLDLIFRHAESRQVVRYDVRRSRQIGGAGNGEVDRRRQTLHDLRGVPARHGEVALRFRRLRHGVLRRRAKLLRLRFEVCHFLLHDGEVTVLDVVHLRQCLDLRHLLFKLHSDVDRIDERRTDGLDRLHARLKVVAGVVEVLLRSIVCFLTFLLAIPLCAESFLFARRLL